ncbi:MAG: hypothetical protein QOJ12_2018 [Thermoleophilales bacterium]|nr:hypothetical protein [Thermoleophilales bacterium]
MDWLAGTRLRLLMAVAMSACAIAAIGASEAHAAGYYVDFDCGRADGWSHDSSSGNYASYLDCGGGWLAGMKTHVGVHNDPRVDNGGASHRFVAPPNSAITGVDWEGYKYYGRP